MTSLTSFQCAKWLLLAAPDAICPRRWQQESFSSSISAGAPLLFLAPGDSCLRVHFSLSLGFDSRLTSPSHSPTCRSSTETPLPIGAPAPLWNAAYHRRPSHPLSSHRLSELPPPRSFPTRSPCLVGARTTHRFRPQPQPGR
jgi:hypothetical protein